MKRYILIAMSLLLSVSMTLGADIVPTDNVEVESIGERRRRLINERRKERFKRRQYNANLANNTLLEGDSFLERVEDRRVDREINESKYIFAGERLFGVTASYATISGDNADLYLLLDGIDATASFASVKPYLGYFYRDNRAVGARFGYSTVRGTVDAATVDLGETNGLSLDIPYVSVQSNTYNYGIFHRSYVSIDRAGHVGLFAEVELSASSGKNKFDYDGTILESRSSSIGASFNPGISVFVLPNLCTTLSFQFGGVSFSRVDQYNEAGEFVGSRESSQMQFFFNVLAMNFGITLHLW